MELNHIVIEIFPFFLHKISPRTLEGIYVSCIVEGSEASQNLRTHEIWLAFFYMSRLFTVCQLPLRFPWFSTICWVIFRRGWFWQAWCWRCCSLGRRLPQRQIRTGFKLMPGGLVWGPDEYGHPGPEGGGDPDDRPLRKRPSTSFGVVVGPCPVLVPDHVDDLAENVQNVPTLVGML